MLMPEVATMVLLLVLAIALIIVGTTLFKIHPFLVLLLVSIVVAFGAGIPPEEVAPLVGEGFGTILQQIGLIIVVGTIMGIILEKSGAALKLAEMLLRSVGRYNPTLALSCIGFIVSIPVFCDSAYIILSALKRSLINRTGKPAIAMSIALATGLYAAHTFVPPTPGPIAAAGNLQLTQHLGWVILFGGLVGITGMMAGYFWAVFMGKKMKTKEDDEARAMKNISDNLAENPLPKGYKALTPILAPIVLITLGTVASYPTHPLGTGMLFQWLVTLGNPLNALLIGLFLCIPLLPVLNKETLHDWITEGIKAAAPILLITGAGGAFGFILKATEIGSMLSRELLDPSLGLVLPFILAAIMKTSQGSSTVALITTSAIMAPLLAELQLATTMGRTLVVLATGAGAMTFSHANDSYFWVVTQFSKLTTRQGYFAFSTATLIQGLITFLATLFISFWM
jgi:GntP family gluconate:H+ symporter